VFVQECHTINFIELVIDFINACTTLSINDTF
jgi:hypothetical protein